VVIHDGKRVVLLYGNEIHLRDVPTAAPDKVFNVPAI
jgi:hypothetical protein